MKSSTSTLLLASGNVSKCSEIRRVLGDLPLQVAALGDLSEIPPEPIEDGMTFQDNARKKALYYAGATGLWCLADDSGLEVDALGGAPGVRSARYATDAGDAVDAAGGRAAIDAANNSRLLKELSGVDESQRVARFVCHLTLADGENVIIEARGEVEGVILDQPRGNNGFGYDPLFFLPELDMTAAELAPDEKNRISHRGRAVREFADKLRALLAGA